MTKIQKPSSRLKPVASRLKGKVGDLFKRNGFTEENIEVWRIFAQTPDFSDVNIKLYSPNKASYEGFITDSQVVQGLLSNSVIPVIGDIHANARKALAFLVLTGRTTMSVSEAETILTLYKNLEDLSIPLFERFQNTLKVQEPSQKTDFTYIDPESFYATNDETAEINQIRLQTKAILSSLKWNGGSIFCLGDAIADQWAFDFSAIDLMEQFKGHFTVFSSSHDWLALKGILQGLFLHKEELKNERSLIENLLVMPFHELKAMYQKDLLNRKAALIKGGILYVHAPVDTQHFQGLTRINIPNISGNASSWKLETLISSLNDWYLNAIGRAFATGQVEGPLENDFYINWTCARPPGSSTQYSAEHFPFYEELQQIVCGHFFCEGNVLCH